MKKSIYSLIFILISFYFLGCNSVNNSTLAPSNIESNNSLYEEIDKLIKVNNLERAGELYIKLKDKENKEATKLTASKLALAHIAKKEYILANFYLQEALAIDPNDEFLKFLLVKNQFLAAALNSSDQSYLKRALKSLESNRYLVNDSDYQILVNTMITRVKLETLWNNKEASTLYKKMNKIEASNIYNNRVLNLGYNPKDIVKY